ncbi:hypothetical protein VTJ04DRAFT_5039 [Mycothermus thermophilus]|uniref:uncharacterized protein n=1 Tax=Humicola insolens TaxID=85995 RepID=UPI0037440B4E
MTAAEEHKEEVRKDDTDRKMPTPSFSSGDASGRNTTSGLGSVPASAASPASSVSSTRPPYIPQFSAATELILKRLKGEPTSLSAVLSQAARSVPITTTFSTIKSDDTKNRVSTSFTASTQMTLQMPAPAPPARPAPSPSSVLPSPAAPAAPTAPAPPVPSLPASKPFTGMSAIRKVTAGLTASSKPAASKPPPPPPEPKAKKVKQTTKGHLGKRKRIKAEDSDSESSRSPSSSSQRSSPAAASPAPAGAATPTSLTATPTSAPVLLTMTKSGRQVLKPASYDPAAIDAASRRHRANHHQSNGGLKGPRTAEQALCRRCSRLHSPANNQMVFCDGCNDAWHQMCHEPRITNEVRDAARGWFCAVCTAKKAASNINNNSISSSGGDKNHVTKSSIAINTTNGAPGSTTLASTSSVKPRTKLPSQPQPRQPERTSWASRPVQAKRAYLSTLSQQELVSLLMSCLEIHPDLPIFPPAPGGSVASPATTTNPTSTNLPDHQHHGHGHGPRSLFAGTSTEGLFPRASSASESFKKGVATNGKAAASSINGGKTTRNHKEDSVHEDQNGGEADEEADPLAALWPRVGEGMYARLPPDVEDDERLVDEGDYEAFSVIVYDERGRKVEENGMKV